MRVSDLLPRYPIYIPSKSRYRNCSAARFLARDGVPFYLVVEPQEEDCYAAAGWERNLLVLPFANRGSVIPARNWIKEHARSLGAERHWQIDDNVRRIRKLGPMGRRIPCEAGPALRATEDFTDRYENVAVSGLNYYMFLGPNCGSGHPTPFFLNVHVYSCCLILNSLPYEWRGPYNEDTDLDRKS